MTMRTCGRVVPFGIEVSPFGVAETLAGRIMFIATLTPMSSEIAGDTQPLESVFGLVIQRAAGALRHFCAVKFSQDLVDIRGGRSHRVGDVLVAQGAITHAVLRQI